MIETVCLLVKAYEPSFFVKQCKNGFKSCQFGLTYCKKEENSGKLYTNIKRERGAVRID